MGKRRPAEMKARDRSREISTFEDDKKQRMIRKDRAASEAVEELRKRGIKARQWKIGNAIVYVEGPSGIVRYNAENGTIAGEFYSKRRGIEGLMEVLKDGEPEHHTSQ